MRGEKRRAPHTRLALCSSPIRAPELLHRGLGLETPVSESPHPQTLGGRAFRPSWALALMMLLQEIVGCRRAGPGHVGLVKLTRAPECLAQPGLHKRTETLSNLSLSFSPSLSLSPLLRKQCFSQQKKTIVLFLLPQDNDFVLIISGKDTGSCHSDQSFCKEINKIWHTSLFCWNWKQQKQNFYYESSQTSTKEE